MKLKIHYFISGVNIEVKRMKKISKFPIFVLLFCGIMLPTGCTKKKISKTDIPKRIISLSPSITETLFAMGLGDRVIGVTSYCNYPPAAKKIEKIGGFSDANFEKIITMHPDLVILPDDKEKQRDYLERFGFPTLTISNSNCTAICSSFALIGKRCSAVNAADSLIQLFTTNLLTNNKDQIPKPRILFCIGRNAPGSGQIRNIYIAGAGTFYNDLIIAAGGINVFSEKVPAYPQISEEGILELQPEIIIDASAAMGNYSSDTFIKDWYSLKHIPAVEKKYIFCISSEYATIPGPRLLILLDDIKHIIFTVKNSQQS